MSVTIQTLQQALTDHFAPWVQDLGLQVVSADTDGVCVRLPQSDQLFRVGGVLGGRPQPKAYAI